MVNVTRGWIKKNVEKLSAFGNQITLENFNEYTKDQKSFESNLTQKGKWIVESCDRKEKFHILIKGIGWADCFPFQDEMKKLGE